MAVYFPPKYDKPFTNLTAEYKNLKGELSDKDAKITLAKFLSRNIGLTTMLLTGIELYPDQIISIKGMMQSNYTLCVWGRGVSKTWTAAIYCILQCIFAPKTTILIAGPTFRTARFIFNHVEKMVAAPEAQMLFHAMGIKSRRNDEFRWSMGTSELIAIPLNGEKIRGFRANVLVIDEFLLMSEEIVEKVLIPYLVVPQDLLRRKRIREKEDKLIANGVITEEQRTDFINSAKLIALSSASFTCEYLYKKYDEYVKAILSANMPKEGAKYFVSQLAWDAIPQDRMDKSIIELAQSNESNSATFQREYGAQFTDGSDSYFSMAKMINCTIPDGEDPTLLLKGKKGEKYVLAIDPNASNSATADHFAMCVVELDESDPNRISGTVIHSYAEAGRDLKDQILYYHYILENFNIILIIIDHAGYQFIEAANESEIMRFSKRDVKIFEFTSEKDGSDLEEQLKNARANYNVSLQRIAFSQYFTTDFIRKSNEWLQGCIDFKRIWFGGSIKGNIDAFNAASQIQLNPNLLDPQEQDSKESFINYFIDNQEILIKQTKYQCASIEVKTTSKGTQSFDLPQIMKRDSSSSRMRRDSYTALLLGAWGMKCYSDIMKVQEETFDTFAPIIV